MRSVKDILESSGGVVKVARAIGRHHTTVMGWTRIPAEHARAIRDLSGLPLHEIRPDLWDAPSRERAA
jgi:hypothetical protein